MNIPIVETLSALTFLTTTGQVILPTASHFSQTDLQTPQVIAKVLFKPKKGSGGINGAAGARKEDSASIYLPKEGSEIALAQSIKNQAKTSRYIPPSRRGAPARTQGGGSR